MQLNWWFYWNDENGKHEYGPFIYEDARDQKEYYEKMNPQWTYYLEQHHEDDESE